MTDRVARDRELFNQIAAEHCRKDMYRPSRLARRHRLRQTLGAVRLEPDVRVLEVGCGAGFSAIYLDGQYREYHGIDHAEELIRIASAQNERPGASFECVDIKDFRPGRRFDVILMIGVLHHLEDLARTVRALVELLEPGGWLLANEPQPANPLISLARGLRKRLDSSYSAEQVELTARELRELYSEAGLTAIELVPQGVLSTPFAEVMLKPASLMRVVAGVSCRVDAVLEKSLGSLLACLSWNLIAVGQKPSQPAVSLGLG